MAYSRATSTVLKHMSNLCATQNEQYKALQLHDYELKVLPQAWWDGKTRSYQPITFNINAIYDESWLAVRSVVHHG